MNAYLDASVILRVLFGEPGQLDQWAAITAPCTSALTRVECARTLDRIRIQGLASPDAAAHRLPILERIFEGIEVVDLSPLILMRASLPLPAPLGTLDSLHLATALAWREQHADQGLVFATHDRALGRAATMMGLAVSGTE